MPAAEFSTERGHMISDTQPDFAAMTMEEMDEWIVAEDAKTPFTSFDLGTDKGRQGLLRKYYMIGDTSLFEAVSHVWASLNEPKATYCTLIGMAAGTGGKGKRGLERISTGMNRWGIPKGLKF